MEKRNSSIELLRLVCLFGIVMLHTFAPFYSNATGVNLVYGVFINSVFNTGVTIFMLISGFFGLYLKKEKLVRLYIEVLMYSVFSTLISCFLSNNWKVKIFIKALMPITTNQYWFLTVYFLILLFSKYINLIPQILSKDDFKKLIGLMIIIFSILPTITQFHIMNDGGKGFANMLLAYYIGRYINLYVKLPYIKINKLKLFLIALFSFTFFVNLFLSILYGGMGVIAPLALDSSITILLSSIFIFILFLKFKLDSNIINSIATHALAIYLFESPVRNTILFFIKVSLHDGSWILSIYILILSFIVTSLCVFVDIFISIFYKYLSNKICDLCKC